MVKPVIVITHERSGTHLLINCINHDKKGQFTTIGFTSKALEFNLKDYKHITYKHIISNAYFVESVNKSHHQVEFMEDYLDFLFTKYKVIYVKRDIKDVLNSYYKFLQPTEIKNFPSFEEWVFSKPGTIGFNFFKPYVPDPHIIIEPENYIHRWFLHTNGWLKYKDKMLVVDYEDMLTNYSFLKQKIENWIEKKIAANIPDVQDKSLPNFGPVKGKIGGYKEIMSEKLIVEIEKALTSYKLKENYEKREPSFNHLNWGLL